MEGFMNKIRVFLDEINYIKDVKIKELVMLTLIAIPDYFFEIPAANSSKHFPTYTLGSGGLVRYTKAACKIAHDVLSLEQYNHLGQATKDVIFAALILHDGLKYGKENTGNAVFEHPLEMSKLIASVNQKYKVVDRNTLFSIVSAVESHMGQWNKDKKNEEVLPKPSTDIQKLVHLFVYLSSRKYLLVDFGVDYYRKERFEGNLEASINNLIEVCKEKISEGFDAEYIYSLIKYYNNGEKNPKKINDINVAEFLTFKISTLTKKAA